MAKTIVEFTCNEQNAMKTKFINANNGFRIYKFVKISYVKSRSENFKNLIYLSLLLNKFIDNKINCDNKKMQV